MGSGALATRGSEKPLSSAGRSASAPRTHTANATSPTPVKSQGTSSSVSRYWRRSPSGGVAPGAGAGVGARATIASWPEAMNGVPDAVNRITTGPPGAGARSGAGVLTSANGTPAGAGAGGAALAPMNMPTSSIWCGERSDQSHTTSTSSSASTTRPAAVATSGRSVADTSPGTCTGPALAVWLTIRHGDQRAKTSSAMTM
jgi:hypothetical protein